MKRRVVWAVVIGIVAMAFVWILLGRKVTYRLEKRKYGDYTVLQENQFTSTVYYAKLELTKEQWKSLREDLIDGGWDSMEPSRGLTRTDMVSDEEFAHATENLSHFKTVYYTLVPKSCRERIVPMEYDNKVILYIMLAVYNPWSRAEY